MIRATVAALLALALSACARSDARRDAWTAEWNSRLDAAAGDDFQHPCATRPFIAWADAFLAGCESDPPEPASADCAARNGWVGERVEQCREWTAWQLRNFGQHERTGGEPPSMRIE